MSELKFTITGDVFDAEQFTLNDWQYSALLGSIDWGDGNTEDYHNSASNGLYHSYETTGTYTITISGFDITRINGNAFNSTGITSVIIPNTVTTIEYGVFAYCNSLESITFEGSTPPTVTLSEYEGEGAFEELPTSCVIRVPTGSLSSYTSAENYPSSSDYEYVEYTPQGASQEEQGQGSGASESPNQNGTLEGLYGHLRTLHKQWFYDKTEMTTNIVGKSETDGLLKNDGTVDENTYLVSDDISGKADSISLSTVATTGSYTDLINKPSTFTPSSHEHDADELSDNSAYTNLNTTANSTQDTINSAIDTKIGALLGVELVEVTSNKGNPTASTMNKLYLVPESTSETNDNYEIFVTVRTGTSPNYAYAWEKLDTARIDLSGYALDTHVHGNISNDGKIGTSSDNFITTTTNGLATNSASIGNITTSGAIGSASGKVAVTGNNGEVTVSDWYVELDSLVVDLINEGLSQQQEQGE